MIYTWQPVTEYLGQGGTAMRVAMAALVASVGVALSGWAMPWPAVADPSDDSCPLSMMLFCSLIPVAPGLDHDIDLTKPPPPADPGAPADEPRPPAELCTDGCS